MLSLVADLLCRRRARYARGLPLTEESKTVAFDPTPGAGNETESNAQASADVAPLGRAYLAATEVLFRDSSHFIGVLDTSGRIRYANPFACRFVGCRKEDVVGRQIDESPWWRHSSRERERLRLALDTARHGHIARLQTTHVAATEMLHAIDCELRPLYDQAGVPFGVLLEATDIGPVRKRRRFSTRIEQAEA
ncbi:MAG: PAS domain-containing protein [Polyangiaceae bacterium]